MYTLSESGLTTGIVNLNDRTPSYIGGLGGLDVGGGERSLWDPGVMIWIVKPQTRYGYADRLQRNYT